MDHPNHVADVTPSERALLARLRLRPGLYLGEPSLRNFAHMSSGYQFAMETAGLCGAHNLLPDGLHEFAAQWYGEPMDARSCFSRIALHEPDDALALERFFEILDAYLVRLGYAPL